MLIYDIAVADGCIQKIEIAQEGVKVFFKDWREDHWLFSFSDVLWLSYSNAINEDISDLNIYPLNAPSDKINLEKEKDTSDYQCYDFISAWSQLSLLKIIARITHTVESIN